MGAAAIFIEDQRAPKRCGHMAGKEVIDAEVMVAKMRAAAAARADADLFLIARTDARATHGLDEALRRGERYLEAGADGVFIEAPQTRRRARAHRARVRRRAAARQHAGRRRPHAAAAARRALPARLRHGGLSDLADLPRRPHDREGAGRLKAGRLAIENEGVDFETFKDITGFEHWAEIEERSGAGERNIEMPGLGWHSASQIVRRIGDRLRLHGDGKRQAGALQGAARGRRQAGAVLSSAHRDRAAGLFPRRRARRSRSPIFPAARAPCRRLIGGSADVVTGSLRAHHPDAGQEPADQSAVVQLGQFPGYVLAVLRRRRNATGPEGPQGHEDRRSRRPDPARI